MLMSWKHRAIFLHPAKTGGSAVRRVLWEQFDFARPPGLTDWHTGFLPRGDDDTEFGYGRYGGWLAFGTVRNPYARLVSLWAHVRAEVDNPRWQFWRDYVGPFANFVEFTGKLLRDGPPPEFAPMCMMLAPCAFVLRQESLADDFARLPFVPAPVPLPVINRHAHPPWPDCYDQPTRELVQRHFYQDFSCYGYSL